MNILVEPYADFEGEIGLGKLDLSQKKRYLTMVIKICKVYRLVPTSHIVLDSELEKLGEKPFKSEEDSNVWPGSYKGQEVLVKVLVRHEADDEMVIKVSVPDPLRSVWSRLTPSQRRFCSEAVIWGRMSHPNILPLWKLPRG